MDTDTLKFIGFALAAGLVFAVIYQLCQLAPNVLKVFTNLRMRKIDQQRATLKDKMIFVDVNRLVIFNIATPILCTIIFALITGFAIGSYALGALVGLSIGIILPGLMIKKFIIARKRKFNSQIQDALMILSSCLKGGLSLLQAIEAIVEELPPPISQEFGLILRENKMGISLEESFERLNKRLPSEELNLLTTAILVARETGGDITQLFGTLVNSIRAKLKLSDNVKTLSMQGKIQGVIMSFLPVIFVMMVYSFNTNYFDVMLSSPLGRGLLIYAVISEIAGVVLIRMFSRMAL